MSGHSHARTIKHKKDLADAQKGQIFSKMARLITLAARQGGNPDENPKLREVINKAKNVNMPSSNVERAIKRGTGEISGGQLEEVIFEAYGPANIAIIIEGITDNKNRSIAEIKKVLNNNNGKLVAEGAVKWLFERKGIITLRIANQPESVNKEDLELKMIDAGAQDIIWRDDELEIHTEVKNLESVKNKLKAQAIEIESFELGWVPKKEVDVSAKQKQLAEKLFEALDENDAVQEIYSNLAT